ncbi:hypothetical protein [Methylomonas sp. MgM2]
MNTNQTIVKVLVLAGVIGAVPFANAEELMVYPANGQSADQMSKDRYECQSWAQQQAGSNQSSQSTTEKGGILRGGARGAAAGAAIGAIAGDAGKGAAIGATGGALKRGFEKIDNQKSAAAQGNENLRRAEAACLEGRGYSVK